MRTFVRLLIHVLALLSLPYFLLMTLLCVPCGILWSLMEAGRALRVGMPSAVFGYLLCAVVFFAVGWSFWALYWLYDHISRLEMEPPDWVRTGGNIGILLVLVLQTPMLALVLQPGNTTLKDNLVLLLVMMIFGGIQLALLLCLRWLRADWLRSSK